MSKFFARQHSKFYQNIFNLTATHRYAMTFGLIAVVSCVWYKLAYLPLRIRIVQQEKIMHKQHEDLHNQNTNDHANSINNSIDILRSSLNEFGEQKKVGESSLVRVLSLLQKAGLVLNDCKIEKEYKCEWYCQEQMFFQASGRLDSVARFLEFLSATSHPFVQCADVRLTHKKDDIFDARLKLKVTVLL